MLKNHEDTKKGDTNKDKQKSFVSEMWELKKQFDPETQEVMQHCSDLRSKTDKIMSDFEQWYSGTTASQIGAMGNAATLPAAMYMASASGITASEEGIKLTEKKDLTTNGSCYVDDILNKKGATDATLTKEIK